MVITVAVYCQNVYVVTKTTDPDPFVHKFDNIDSLCDPEIYGTLQWAINKVNNNTGDSRIEFNIPGVGPHEIILNYYLPQIKNATIIDGSTQSGYSYGNPQIIINAQHKHKSIFDVYSNNITIKGLKLTSFAQNGILLHECSNSLIAENIISNYSINSSNTPYTGLFINGCQNVEVYGNNIEVALDETVDEKTKSYGVYLSKSFNCIIGGTDTNLANTIKNCRNYGVFPRCSQNIKISGNIIYGSEKAIYLDSSNDNIQPPEISEYTNGILSGTALPHSTIEVFESTAPENANEYLASVVADENGNWGVELSTTYEHFSLTQTDINNNTSNFSNIFVSSFINCDSVFIIGSNTVHINQRKQFIGSGSPSLTKPWSSSNPKIAIIDNFGFITGIAKGTTTITYIDQSGCKATLEVTVKEKLLYEQNKFYMLVKDSTINISDLPEIINTYGFIKLEKPFKAIGSDYFMRLYRITVNDDIKIDSVFLNEILNLEITEFVEKIPISYSFYDFCNNPEDPHNIEQYYLDKINANAACEYYYPYSTTNDRTVVAVIDQPIYINHEDLIGNSSNNHCDASTINEFGECLSTNPNPTASILPHGTQVAGLVGAVTDNNIGISSIGWNNKIMAVKSNDEDGYIVYGYDGIIWAVKHGAKVINMSWGSEVPCSTHYKIFKDFRNSIIDGDVVFVAACGNYANAKPQYPAAYGEGFNEWEDYNRSLVIAVANIDENNDRSTYTTYGKWVDICTYGDNVFTTDVSINSWGNESTYGAYSGTSFAAPIVAGVVGHMKSYKLSASAEEIYNCLIGTANQDIYNSYHPYNIPGTLGYGRLDAEKAIKCLGGDCSNGKPIAVITPSNKTLCPGGSVTLTANEGVNWLWSTGETTQSIEVNTIGAYCVTVTFADGCENNTCYKLKAFNGNASLYVIENSGNYSNDGIVCQNDNFSLHASDGLSYQWSCNPYNTQDIWELNTGNNYCVTIQGIDGCPGMNGSACLNVSYINLYELVDPGEDRVICIGDELTLNAQPDGFTTYYWEKYEGGLTTWSGQTVNITNSANYSHAARYYLMVDDNSTGCSTFPIPDLECSVEISVVSNTDELIIEPIPDLCIGSQSVLLEANIAGVQWSGDGVVGNLFDPEIAGIGDHIISCTTAESDCLLSASIVVSVVEGFPISINNIPPLCKNDNPFIITTTPPYTHDLLYDWFFWGPGVKYVYDGNTTTVYFYPNIAGPGTHTIYTEYEYDGCINYDEMEVTVYDTPLIYPVSPLCENSDPIELFANVIGGIWTGTGVTNNYFDPSIAGVGQHAISYEYNNGTITCNSEIIIEVIEQITDINITEIPFICDSNSPVELTATPENGTWSGTGVIGNNFYPNLAGNGTHAIIYTYGKNTSCEISEQTIISVENYNITTSNPCYNNNLKNIAVYITPNGASGNIKVFKNSDLLNPIIETSIFYYSNLDPLILDIEDFETGQDYTITLTTETNCTISSDINIPSSCQSLMVTGNLLKATCINPFNPIIELNITYGLPPYIIRTFAYQESTPIISDMTAYTDGVYRLDLTNAIPNGFNGNVVVKVTDSQNNSKNIVFENQDIMSFAWANGLTLTNANISNYESLSNMTIRIGNANNQKLNILQNLTFTNCTIYTATNSYTNVSETQWTVYNPYTLKLDNTIVKSGCPDKMWQGIRGIIVGEAIPGDDPTSIPPSQLLVYNSEIHDAIKAVEASNGPLGAVVIKANNSKFYNNVYSLYFNWCNFSQSSCVIRNNHFITNNILNNPYLYPKAHVYMNYVNGLIFRNNHFENTLPPHPAIPHDVTYTAEKRGTGIDATMSSFTITPITFLLNPSTSPLNSKNYFKGLYYAVSAKGQKTYAPKIHHSDFENNFRGVYMRDINGARLLFNKFETTQENLSFEIIGIPLNAGLPKMNASYAAYIANCNNFKVEENTFKNGDAGLYAYNNGEAAGLEIYKNYFGNQENPNNYNMIAGTIVVGKNSNWDNQNIPNIHVGLQTRCNTYSSTQNAISVINGNMRKNQGNQGGETDKLAGNQFHNVYKPLTDFKVQISSSNYAGFNYSHLDLGKYNYWQHKNNQALDFYTQLDNYTELKILTHTLDVFNPSNSCPSHYPTIDFEFELARISAFRVDMDDKQNQYYSLVDRGDTENLINLVESMSNRNFNSIFPTLCNNGYLSDQVFESILDNRATNRPRIASILIQNSPLPENIMEMVENSNYLQNGHKKQIRRVQNGISSRLISEYEIADIKQNISRIESNLINHAIDNDSVPSVRETVINYLTNNAEVNDISYINKFNLQLAQTELGDAQNTLNQLRTYALGLQNPDKSLEIQRFCDIHDIYISLLQDTVYDNTLLVENQEFLREAALDFSSMYSGKAQTLYELATDSVFIEYTPLPYDEFLPKSMIIDNEQEEDIFMAELNIYPNPTRDKLFIEYNFTSYSEEGNEDLLQTLGYKKHNDCRSGEISIYTIDGKMIISKTLEQPSGLESIDMKDYPPASYLIKITDCYGFSKEQKFVKQ